MGINIIKVKSSREDDLQKGLKMVGDMTERLIGTNRTHWLRVLEATLCKLSKAERLQLIERFYGSPTLEDVKMLIEMISQEQTCEYLKLEPKSLELGFSYEQIAEAGKSGLMLSSCPAGLTLKGVQEKIGNRIVGEEKFLYSGNNTDAWYKKQNENFYFTTQSRPGYYFSTKSGLEGSGNKNYLQQTEMLATWLLSNSHLSTNPELIIEAIDDFNSKKESIAKTLKKDWQQAGSELTALPINQNFRENGVEFAVRMLSYRKAFGKYIFSGQYAWLNELASDSVVVSLGFCGADGMDEDGWGADSDGGGSLVVSPRLQ